MGIVEERRKQIDTIVEFLITIGMLELNRCDGIAVAYQNGNVEEMHIDNFKNMLLFDLNEYNNMCRDVLFAIAESNLKQIDEIKG